MLDTKKKNGPSNTQGNVILFSPVSLDFLVPHYSSFKTLKYEESEFDQAFPLLYCRGQVKPYTKDIKNKFKRPCTTFRDTVKHVYLAAEKTKNMELKINMFTYKT